MEDEADSSPVAAGTSNTDAAAAESSVPKKKGRPTKRERTKKAKDAVASLDKWLDKNTYTYLSAEDVAGPSSVPVVTKTTHTLISHPPTASRAIYTMQKSELLGALEQLPRPTFAAPTIDPALEPPPGQEVLMRANDAVLARLRRIDEMAAEQGLEVGGEGGEMTGLARVERAVREHREGVSRGGILNLLDGAGVEMPVGREGGQPEAER